MQIAIYMCGAFNGIGAVIIGVLFYYHKETPAIWTTFSTIMLFILGACLFWQSKVIEKQSLNKAVQEPTKQPTGIVVRNSENIKVYGNTVIGTERGYLSENNKNIEFKNNEHIGLKK